MLVLIVSTVLVAAELRLTTLSWLDARIDVRQAALKFGQKDFEPDKSDLLVAMHGITDSMYIKELAKKTHRGVEGRFLKDSRREAAASDIRPCRKMTATFGRLMKP